MKKVMTLTVLAAASLLALPGGCNSVSASGVTYYNCGNAYYQPHFGSNGVYYTVVASPF